ncbi:MAG: zinc dependent phospholipase C family protein [Silvibacterium sp.]
MPGPFIHMSAMQHAGLRLARERFSPGRSERVNPAWTGANTMQLGQLMGANRNYANLGAIGPDLFFFLPDFRDEHGISVSSVLVTVLDFLENLYTSIDPYITKYEQYLGPISEDTAEEMSRLTGGLNEIVGDITGELSSILITALEDFVSGQKDWWEFFSLGLNQGYDEQAYFWSDMLHYRETGSFARAIWKNADASKDDGARAYALGYITHIATDVTGHAFVNSISGGPFRLHWQRHHLVENHMDAFWYLNDPNSPRVGNNYPQLTESALYFDIAFDEDTNGTVSRPSYPTGGTLRENWERKSLLDIDSDMPDPLPDVLLQSMIDVFYQGGPHPKILSDNNGRPSSDLIRQAYDLFYRYLKLVTVDGFSHEPPDPPDVFPNLSFPTISQPAGDDPPGGGGGGSGGGGSFWDDLLDFILSVVQAIAYAVEVAVYLATLPWAVLADIVTYPLRLGLYYALELPLFHLLKTFRAVLVMTGYMLPMDDEVASILIQVGNSESGTFTEVLNLDGDVFAGLLPPPVAADQTYRDANYPHSHPDDEYRHPWSYPSAVRELHFTGLDPNPPTTSGPHAADSDPAVLFGNVSGSPGIRDRFENAASPGDADAIGQDVTPDIHLGDSVAFSQYLIWLESRDAVQEDGTEVPLTEWNLDSDCGYGYHCWDWNRNPNVGAQPDPEGNMFQQPCTWPSQSDDSLDPAAPANWNSAVPLQLHWAGTGLIDPGCQATPSPGVQMHGAPVEVKAEKAVSRKRKLAPVRRPAQRSKP